MAEKIMTDITTVPMRKPIIAIPPLFGSGIVGKEFLVGFLARLIREGFNLFLGTSRHCGNDCGELIAKLVSEDVDDPDSGDGYKCDYYYVLGQSLSLAIADVWFFAHFLLLSDVLMESERARNIPVRLVEGKSMIRSGFGEMGERGWS
jgi:hypothetical protein